MNNFADSYLQICSKFLSGEIKELQFRTGIQLISFAMAGKPMSQDEIAKLIKELKNK